jgi:hypothetical protein
MAGLQFYLEFFEALSPESLDRLDELTIEDVHFRDPFNDLHERASMRLVFERMFGDVHDPRFSVIETASREGLTFVKWRSGAAGRNGRQSIAFDGVSEIRFGPDGWVAEHVDYWDPAAAIYEAVPVLGFMLRQICRHLGVTLEAEPRA